MGSQNSLSQVSRESAQSLFKFLNYQSRLPESIRIPPGTMPRCSPHSLDTGASTTHKTPIVLFKSCTSTSPLPHVSRENQF
eukprot:jgi/Botrbrau1/7489/Bobra.0095s0025.1